MWRFRTLGSTLIAIGVVSLVLIPFLVWADRADEVPGAIGVGVVGIGLGIFLVRLLRDRA